MRIRSVIGRVVAIIGLGLATDLAAKVVSNRAPPREAAQAQKPHRLLVLTDVENEPDDTESMVRLLLYSDVIDIQGLIATTSAHLKTRVAPESIQAVIRAYFKVHGNLVRHDPNYPPAEVLQSLVKKGRPEYGMNDAATRPIWTDTIDEYTAIVTGEHGRATRQGETSFEDFRTTLWRWRDDFQNDFAARMDWTTRPYREANHPPIPALNHCDSPFRTVFSARRARNHRPGWR